MRVLMSRVHRARLRELVAGEGLPSELVPDVLDLQCPRCGEPYFADLGPEEPEPPELEWLEYRAVRRLLRECPDHAHRFDISEA